MLARILSLAVVTTCVSSVASAQIISVDDPGGFGVGAFTRDMAQGLDFLDVTFSVARPYNDVSGHFGAGGDFDGFRYATQLEVITLVNNFGFSPGAVPGGVVTGDVGGDQLSGLVALLGVTDSKPTRLITIGMAGSPFGAPPAHSRMALVEIFDFTDPFTEDLVRSNFNTQLVQFSWITNGSYLVLTTPIPEPSSLILCLLAAIALVGLGWRRRKRKIAA